MKKISEVAAMGLVDLTNPDTELEGRIFVSGEPTTCMQLRVLYKGGKDENPMDIFSCGIDVVTLKSGRMIATTVLGFWSYNLFGCIRHILEYYDDRDFKNAYGVYLCDDTMNLPEPPGDGPMFLGCGKEVDFMMRDIEKIEF